MTGSNWDQFTSSTDPVVQSSIRNTVGRLATFSPYFDQKLSWMPHAYVYYDSYAIYTNSAIATQHPEWILKDAQGRKLYIPWGCANGVCPQYAADVSNPAYRSYQIDQIKSLMLGGNSTSFGYNGLWFDDVNLNLSVGDGNGNLVSPMDSHTGQPMTADNWKLYFVQYLEMVRAALPSTVEILHNSVWYATGTQDPYLRRQVAAADYINVERGFGDSGITGGTGQYSLFALMQYIDYVHSLGTSVVIEDLYMADQTYSLACYFLIQNGVDYFGIQEQTPGNWPAHLYSVNLGAATNARHKWSNVWRRDFANGFALANEPGAPAQVITLPQPMVDPNGNLVTVVSLTAKQGGIYLYPAN